MQYWGWRPLVLSLWLSVIITACSDHPSRPSVTPTWLPAPQSMLNATDPPLADLLIISPPVCTETATDTLLCIGDVTNPHSTPLTGIQMGVYLHQSDGTTAVQVVALPLARLHPGQRAPYHVLFVEEVTRAWQGKSAASARVLRAAWASAPHDSEARAVLRLEGLRWVGQGDYGIAHATLVNAGALPISSARAVVSVQDRTGRLLTYRAVDLPAMRPNERVDLRVRLVIPADTQPIGPLVATWLAEAGPAQPLSMRMFKADETAEGANALQR